MTSAFQRCGIIQLAWNLNEAGLAAAADAGLIPMNPQWQHLREILDPQNWRNSTEMVHLMTDVFDRDPCHRGSTDQIFMSLARFFRGGQ